MAIQFKDSKHFPDPSDEERSNCVHAYEKEYYLATATGDYVCSKCGDSILRVAYIKLRKEENKNE